ncbi:MAG: MFS transporter [Simkaniaceae bacterium]|nr:MFS transporter [Simkaniaceae bacterium]
MKGVKAKISILLVLFLGYIGYSLSLPIFPILFADPHVAITDSTGWLNAALLGGLIASYPLGQFFGSPLIGKLSDKYGRKFTLSITLGAIIPAHLLTGLMIDIRSLTGLYIARLLCGLLEGNIVIGQASIADLNGCSQSKAKDFGWITAVVSSAFIFGPLIGGQLAEFVGYSSPFYMAAGLALLSLLGVLYFFYDTKPPKPTLEVRLHDTFSLIIENLKKPTMGYVYFCNFLFYMAVLLFFNFISVYLLKVFAFDVAMLGFANGYLSIPIALTPLFFRKTTHPRKTLAMASLFFGFSLLILLIPSTPTPLYLTLLPTGICSALGLTACPLLVSNLVDEHSQGEALGVNQSVMVLAESVTGIVGGFLIAISPGTPLIAGVFFAILCAFITLPRTMKNFR